MRRAFAAALVLASILALPLRAHEEDAGAVAHSLSVLAEPGRIVLEYRATPGGLLTDSFWRQIDTDGDGLASTAEQAAHVRLVAGALRLKVKGQVSRWLVESAHYPTRVALFGDPPDPVRLRLSAALPPVPQAGLRVEVRDDTFPLHRVASTQPEVRARALGADGMLLQDGGRTLTLRLLPASAALPTLGSEPGRPDLLPGLRLDPNAPQAAAGSGRVLYAAPKERGDEGGLRGLLGKPLTPALILFGLGAALLAGMAHALSPGHGKAMVAAYLTGSRGTVGDAILLGIVVTITHTLGVYILGALSLWLTTRIQADIVAHWLGVVSGALVLILGFWLFQRGLLAYHGVGQPHGHSHAHGHPHAHGHSHSHDADPRERPAPADSPLEPLEPAQPQARPTRWSVVGLGIAGGIVPCFDALAILIAAVNLGSITIGLALIASFSVGMALVLVLVGILMVKARSVVERFTGEQRWTRALPALSGAILVLLGAWLTLQSLGATGLLRLGA